MILPYHLYAFGWRHRICKYCPYCVESMHSQQTARLRVRKMAEDEDKGYRWETEYERTWEALQEDAEGSLQPSIDDMIHKAKRRKLLEKIANVRLGMMRHMFIIIDMSLAMEDQDLKPTRLVCSAKLLENFIEEYFDQNPISQLGIIVTKNKRGEKVTELGGNPRRHITALQKLKERACQGESSLQNSLELAMQTLRHMPSHSSREILALFGSLTTCDPGDILETLKMLKENHIRCSMIGLAAEVRICKKLCTDTNGQYSVILDESHFKDLLNQNTSPPPAMDVHLKTLPGFLSHYTDPGTWYCKDQGMSKQPNLTEKISAGPQLVVKQEPIEIIDLEGSSNERRAFETKVERTSLVGSAYKERLKQKILERRRAEGKQMIDLAKEEEIRQRQLELTQHLTKEDLERRRRKRLQNNLAAKRCRENRKQFHIRMEKEFDIQMSRRKQLLQAMEELKKEKGTIVDIWKACNRGVVTDETKRKIDYLIKTDFEKFVPEPLQAKPFSLVSEDSNELPDGEKSSITLDNENKVFSVEGHEVNEATILAQMFQVGSKWNNIVHSGESTESSASAEEDSVTGSEIMPTNSNSINVPVFLDLTKDSKDLPNHVNSANSPNELHQANVSAGSMLLELEEATYSKMTAEEELVKQIRNTEACMRERKHKQNLDDDDDDDDNDEDDFTPLVIDLAK